MKWNIICKVCNERYISNECRVGTCNKCKEKHPGHFGTLNKSVGEYRKDE